MTVQFDLAGENAAPTHDAATVLLLRDGPSEGDLAGPRVFFVKRNAGARFMGGAYVFPGGRLDPGDRAGDVPCDLDMETAAKRLGESDPERALGLHVAALRESLEEAGLLLATTAVPFDVIASLRAVLSPRGAPPIGPLLRERGITLRVSALAPLARWVTPRAETRRFDARFFVARADAHLDEATHDGGETVDSAWLTPREAITRAERGEIVLAPPTWWTLHTLRDARDVQGVLTHAPFDLTPTEPRVEARDDKLCVMLPESASAVLREQLPGFSYEDGVWMPLRKMIPSG
jgi:8-oxo-dGTP pyrophosphatase MutT (NUDIX family)